MIEREMFAGDVSAVMKNTTEKNLTHWHLSSTFMPSTTAYAVTIGRGWSSRVPVPTANRLTTPNTTPARGIPRPHHRGRLRRDHRLCPTVLVQIMWDRWTQTCPSCSTGSVSTANPLSLVVRFSITVAAKARSRARKTLKREGTVFEHCCDSDTC